MLVPSGKLQITVDPRIELLSALQLISNYQARWNLLTRFDHQYRSDMLHHFEPYGTHPAVRFYSDISDWFSFSAPPQVMLCLADPPSLTVEQDILSVWGAPAVLPQVHRFIKLLRASLITGPSWWLSLAE